MLHVALWHRECHMPDDDVAPCAQARVSKRVGESLYLGMAPSPENLQELETSLASQQDEIASLQQQLAGDNTDPDDATGAGNQANGNANPANSNGNSNVGENGPPPGGNDPQNQPDPNASNNASVEPLESQLLTQQEEIRALKESLGLL